MGHGLKLHATVQDSVVIMYISEHSLASMIPVETLLTQDLVFIS